MYLTCIARFVMASIIINITQIIILNILSEYLYKIDRSHVKVTNDEQYQNYLM